MYYRASGGAGHPDPQVAESVTIELHLPDDTRDRITARLTVDWVPHFVDGSLAPRITAEGMEAKFLAFYPELLHPFTRMSNGSLSPDLFVEGLLEVGIQQNPNNTTFVSTISSCATCGTQFREGDIPPAVEEVTRYRCRFCAIRVQESAGG